jgi:microcystin-dependent protein
MATITANKGYNNPTGWISGEEVTPAKLNLAQTPSISISDIVDADVSASAGIAGSKLANDSVTLAKLVTAVQQSLLPAGAVQAFAMNSAPAGWLAADGSNVSRTTYASLFSAIGTTYGAGDGSTTFAVPDLRGYFVRGSGTNGDGTAAGTFGAKQADALKAHQHFAFKSGSSTTALSAANHPATQGQIGTDAFKYTIAGNADASDVGLTSSTGDTETRPKNIAMLYCVKF